MKDFLQKAFGILVLGLIVWLLGTILYTIVELARQTDTAIVLAIITASATVISSTLVVVLSKHFERKKEIESHFRQSKIELYDDFTKMLFGLLHGKREVNDGFVDELREWQRRLILRSGPKTIKIYTKWMEELRRENYTIETVLMLGDLFLSIREEIGLSNRELQREDYWRLMLKESDVFVELAKSDPNARLTALDSKV